MAVRKDKQEIIACRRRPRHHCCRQPDLPREGFVPLIPSVRCNSVQAVVKASLVSRWQCHGNTEQQIVPKPHISRVEIPPNKSR